MRLMPGMRALERLRSLLRAPREAAEARLLARARERAEAALREELAALNGPEGPRPRLAEGRRDLVMGLALGYGPRELAPFLRSLRATGYGGEVWLLTGPVPAATRDFLAAHGARSLPFIAIRTMPMSMNSARMYGYLDALAGAALHAAAEDLPGRILLADTRDVVFQADPFAALGASRLRFHLESARRLADCPVNRDWLARALGPAAVDELGARPIACAGTLLGTAEAVFEYLCLMGALLTEVPPRHRLSGVDQAIHNAMLWRGLLRGADAVPNGAEVLTVPPEGLGALARIEAGRIRNADGSLSAIVHQYDRDAAAAAALAERFGL